MFDFIFNPYHVVQNESKEKYTLEAKNDSPPSVGHTDLSKLDPNLVKNNPKEAVLTILNQDNPKITDKKFTIENGLSVDQKKYDVKLENGIYLNRKIDGSIRIKILGDYNKDQDNLEVTFTKNDEEYKKIIEFCTQKIETSEKAEILNRK